MFDLTQKLEGVVLSKTFNVKNQFDDTVEDVTHHFDFSNLTVGDALQKALRTIVIDDQRALRVLKVDAIEKTDNTTLLVENVGKKPEDPASLINRLKATGMSTEEILALLGGGE